ncbi:MAG: hypothetical protein M3304_07985 [Actinomycetota bacterium]|nr:hypothetical protein [Actinomycetota bacterium]
MKRFLLVLATVLALAAWALPATAARAELPDATCNTGTATAHSSIPMIAPGNEVAHASVPCG